MLVGGGGGARSAAQGSNLDLFLLSCRLKLWRIQLADVRLLGGFPLPHRWGFVADTALVDNGSNPISVNA